MSPWVLEDQVEELATAMQPEKNEEEGKEAGGRKIMKTGSWREAGRKTVALPASSLTPAAEQGQEEDRGQGDKTSLLLGLGTVYHHACLLGTEDRHEKRQGRKTLSLPAHFNHAACRARHARSLGGTHAVIFPPTVPLPPHLT